MKYFESSLTVNSDLTIDKIPREFIYEFGMSQATIRLDQLLALMGVPFLDPTEVLRKGIEKLKTNNKTYNVAVSNNFERSILTFKALVDDNDNNDTAILKTDKNFKIKSINRSLTKLLGFKEKEIISLSLMDLLYPNDRNRVKLDTDFTRIKDLRIISRTGKPVNVNLHIRKLEKEIIIVCN